MRIAVLGAGLQGVATTLDLAWSKDVKEVLLADIDIERARHVAEQSNKRYGEKVEAVSCDASDVNQVADLIRDWDVVINEVNYHLNRNVMEACLQAGVNYIDLGGLYKETLEQLKYHDRFEKAGLLALVGIGGTPGLTNVCARWAADRMDAVEEINIYCGSNDWSKSSKAFTVSYAIDTIMDEFSFPSVQFINGEYAEQPPLSGQKVVNYPQPVGDQRSFYILHSEIATLPEYFKDKGVKTCTFRVGFPDETYDKLKFLAGLGFGRKEPIEVEGTKVTPLNTLKKLMELQPEDEKEQEVNDCDIIKIEVKGTKAGKTVEYVLEAICRPVKEWPELMGAQVYIGGAASWAAQMLLRGDIKGTGVLPPEACIPPEIIFEEAAKREIYIYVDQRHPLGFDNLSVLDNKKKINQWK